MFGVLTNGWPVHASALYRKSSIRMTRKLGRCGFWASRGPARLPRASRLDSGMSLYLITIFVGSNCGLGNLISRLSRASRITWETARFRNHFLSVGITYQGARSELHSLIASSYARTYSSQ